MRSGSSARVGSRVATLLAGALIGWVIGEVATRLALPHLPVPSDAAWKHDDVSGFRLNPSPLGSFDQDDDRYVNRHGFRDRDYELTKPEGTWRLIGIGDSFVYGAVPIAHNFLRVCERRLREESASSRPDVLLLGCPGYSPEHESALLERFGLALDPDLVVICFFVGNDVTGIPLRGEVLAGRMYVADSPIPVLDLARRSRLFQLVESAGYRPLKQRWSRSTTRAIDPVTEPRDATEPYLRILRNNSRVYESPPSASVESLWQRALHELERIDTACRSAGVPWLLVLIPTEEQVDDGLRKKAFAKLDIDPNRHDLEYPQRRLRGWAEGRGVPTLDLLPRLRAAHADSMPLYLPNDTHWNERGNAVAGEALADRVASLRAGSARN